MMTGTLQGNVPISPALQSALRQGCSPPRSPGLCSPAQLLPDTLMPPGNLRPCAGCQPSPMVCDPEALPRVSLLSSSACPWGTPHCCACSGWWQMLSDNGSTQGHRFLPPYGNFFHALERAQGRSTAAPFFRIGPQSIFPHNSHADALAHCG